MPAQKFSVLRGYEPQLRQMVLGGERAEDMAYELEVNPSTIYDFLEAHPKLRERWRRKKKRKPMELVRGGYVTHPKIDRALLRSAPKTLDELAALVPRLNTKESVRRYLIQSGKHKKWKAKAKKKWNRH